MYKRQLLYCPIKGVTFFSFFFFTAKNLFFNFATNIIDEKVKEIIDEGYNTAKKILKEKSKDLENLALGLLEYETLTGTEIVRVISGKSLNRNDDDSDNMDGIQSSVVSIPRTKKIKLKDDGALDPEPSN
mgnify:CR=1 FL=1